MTIRVQPVKLPIGQTVGDAFAATWANIGYLAHISWAWVLVMMPIVVAYRWAAERYNWGDVSSGNPMALVAMVVDAFLLAPMLASIAVAWHRKLLTGEEWPSPVYLRFDRLVRRYVLIAALITLWMLAPIWAGIVLDNLGFGPSLQPNSTVAFVGIGLALVGLYVATRHWLALPGLALAHDDASLGQSWRHTRANATRILLACFLCMLPAMAYYGLLRRLVTIDASSDLLARVAHATANDFLATFLLSMPLLSLLSLAYRHLAEPPEHAAKHVPV